MDDAIKLLSDQLAQNSNQLAENADQLAHYSNQLVQIEEKLDQRDAQIQQCKSPEYFKVNRIISATIYSTLKVPQVFESLYFVYFSTRYH